MNTFNPDNKEHKAIVVSAMCAADALGLGRISAAKEQLAFNDIAVKDRDQLMRYVYTWGAEIESSAKQALADYRKTR
jgi:hypothetical protein